LQTPYAFINDAMISFQKIYKKQNQKYVISFFRLVHSTFGVIVSMPFLYAGVHLIVEKFCHKTPQNSVAYIEYADKCIPTLWFLPVALLN
jgi:hypothetical protein